LELAGNVHDPRNAAVAEGVALAADSDADLRLAMAAIAALRRPDRRAGRLRCAVPEGVVAPVTNAFDFSEQQIMLAVLGLIDVVMISNLLMMVIVGGYETFVSRLNLKGHPDEPEWLSHVNASVLKIKLAMAIIGISSIHLLRTFIEAGGLVSGKTGYTETGVMWQTIIHTVFILSAIGIAYVDRLSNISTEEAKHSVSH
jgi:uncharacterized protein (TIGR00645 family)